MLKIMLRIYLKYLIVKPRKIICEELFGTNFNIHYYYIKYLISYITCGGKLFWTIMKLV